MQTQYTFVRNLEIIRRKEGNSISRWCDYLDVNELVYYRWKNGSTPSTESVEKVIHKLEVLLGKWISWDILADENMTDDEFERLIYGDVI